MTPAQLAVIHLAKKQLGFDDEVYRAILKRFGNVESAKDLTNSGFDQVMAYFTSLGFRSDWTKKTFGHRSGMATPAQITKVRNMWDAFTGRNDDHAALNKWLERTFKVSALRFLTKEKAQSAITALKSMTDRPHQPPQRSTEE